MDLDLRIGSRFDPFPEDAYSSQVDYTVSYLSPWILPDYALKSTKLAAINFHPGPPEYPGTGCTNFAIYDQVDTYGVTAHIMNQTVDSGQILMVSRFPVLSSDSVYDLTEKCYREIIRIFPLVMDSFLRNIPIPQADERWTKKATTRKQLDQLCRIECSMSKEEIARRIKATSYPGMPGAFIELFGNRFEYKANEE